MQKYNTNCQILNFFQSWIMQVNLESGCKQLGACVSELISLIIYIWCHSQ